MSQVCCWPIPEEACDANEVRILGLSGLNGCASRLQSLTRSRHRANCGAYDCEAMALVYRRTGRAPDPIEAAKGDGLAEDAERRKAAARSDPPEVAVARTGDSFSPITMRARGPDRLVWKCPGTDGSIAPTARHRVGSAADGGPDRIGPGPPRGTCRDQPSTCRETAWPANPVPGRSRSS